MPPKKDASRTRAKKWCLTIFNKEEWKALEVCRTDCEHWSWQEEKCPETGVCFFFGLRVFRCRRSGAPGL